MHKLVLMLLLVMGMGSPTLLLEYHLVKVHGGISGFMMLLLGHIRHINLYHKDLPFRYVR